MPAHPASRPSATASRSAPSHLPYPRSIESQTRPGHKGSMYLASELAVFELSGNTIPSRSQVHSEAESFLRATIPPASNIGGVSASSIAYSLLPLPWYKTQSSWELTAPVILRHSGMIASSQ